MESLEYKSHCLHQLSIQNPMKNPMESPLITRIPRIHLEFTRLHWAIFSGGRLPVGKTYKSTFFGNVVQTMP